MNFYDPATFEPFREADWPWDDLQPLFDKIDNMQRVVLGVQVVYLIDDGRTLEEAVSENLSLRPFYRELFGKEVETIAEESARTYLKVLEGLSDSLRYEHKRVLHHLLASFIRLTMDVRKIKGLDA